MSLTIPAVSRFAQGPDIAARAPPPAPRAQPPSVNARANVATTGQVAAPAAQQQAALTQLMAKYAYAQSHGAAASTLSNLGKQILADAKALGRHVRLPTGPTASGPDTAAETGLVNLKA